MAKEYLKNYELPEKVVADILNETNSCYEDIKEKYHPAFQFLTTQDCEEKYLNSVDELKTHRSIKALVETCKNLVELVKYAEAEYVYHPRKSSIEGKCTLRDVYLRRGYSEEYLDDWAMGLLGKSKTLWVED